ncbi:hypothetical protein [Microbacterium sp.]|uniref:hypothetical protein n=1 Tax=Microbacterium sp. TaxID=51671 RepID=UPI0026247900|nr:hypothetical protein [Microbacterium sp.]
MAAVALVAGGVVGLVLSGSNAMGAPAETFAILQIMRVMCAVAIVVIPLLLIPFLLRPALLPVLGVSLYAIGMVAAAMLSAFLRDEPLLWVPAVAAVLSAIASIVQLNRSYTAREEQRGTRDALGPHDTETDPSTST